MTAKGLLDYFAAKGILVRPYWKPLAICGWALVGMLIVLLLVAQRDNAKLHDEHAQIYSILSRAESSCAVQEGARVVCELRRVSRGLELTRLEVEKVDIPLLKQLEAGTLGLYAKGGKRKPLGRNVQSAGAK